MVEIHVTFLKSLAAKSRGLLAHQKASPVLIKTRFGIHTFGMRFPIDVLILNKNDEVVKTAENLKPNRIFIWSLFYDTVVELPAGEITKRNIKIGEKVKLKLI